MADCRSLVRSCLRSSTKAQILTERTERGIEYAGPLAWISRESIRLSKGRTRAGTAAGLFQVHLIFWCACSCRSMALFFGRHQPRRWLFRSNGSRFAHISRQFCLALPIVLPTLLDTACGMYDYVRMALGAPKELSKLRRLFLEPRIRRSRPSMLMRRMSHA